MFGELYEASWEPGTNADFMRTVSMYRLLRVLMMEDSPEKVATMRRYVAWLNNALAIAPGWLDTIKPEACRKNVETRFSAPVMARGYEAVYRQLVE